MSVTVPGGPITVATKPAPTGATRAGELQLMGQTPGPGLCSAANRPAPIAASVANVLLLANNADRIGAKITNDSPAILYIKEANTAATSTDWDEIVYPGGVYHPDGGYTGPINGIWSAAGSGQARIVEYV